MIHDFKSSMLMQLRLLIRQRHFLGSRADDLGYMAINLWIDRYVHVARSCLGASQFAYRANCAQQDLALTSQEARMIAEAFALGSNMSIKPYLTDAVKKRLHEFNFDVHVVNCESDCDDTFGISCD